MPQNHSSLSWLLQPGEIWPSNLIKLGMDFWVWKVYYPESMPLLLMDSQEVQRTSHLIVRKLRCQTDKKIAQVRERHLTWGQVRLHFTSCHPSWEEMLQRCILCPLRVPTIVALFYLLFNLVEEAAPSWSSLLFKLSFLSHAYMSMGVFCACMSEHQKHVLPTEARILWNWS